MCVCVCACVCVCVCLFFFFRANMTIMSSLPTHNIKNNFFNMRRVNLSALHLTACSVMSLNVARHLANFCNFFSSIIYFDTMQ